MALSKIKGTVIADDAINADRIEDGTVVASDILDNTITGGKLATDITISTTGSVTANTFSGDGSSLTALNISTDSTPQLGGDLDLNSNDITGTGNINITGTVTADGVDLGDNERVRFGASQDLQMWHSGLNSFVVEGGTGNLYLGSNGTSVSITQGAGGESMGVFNINGSVELYYDNSKKFETTSTGIDVTGSGNFGSTFNTLVGGLSGNSIDFDRDGTSYIRATNASGSIQFTTGGTTNRFEILPGGNVTFNETGADADFRVESNNDTHALFVDAGNDRIGIGTNSPNSAFEISKGSAQAVLSLKRDDVASTGNTLARIDIVNSVNNTLASIAGRSGNGNTEAELLFFTGTNNLRVKITKDGHLFPETTNTYDLGSSINKWKDLYLSGSAYTEVVQGLGDEAGLTFGGAIVAPRKNNAAADGTVDLGISSARFKDFYLGGDIYLGGITSANALDDYEEGTWTPSVAGGVSVTSANYVKIGRFVHVNFEIVATSNNSGDFSGLPFTWSGRSAGIVGYQNDNSSTWSIVTEGGTGFSFRAGSTQQHLEAGELARGSLMYMTA